MDALVSMQSFLRGRPSVFKSLEGAIEWRYVIVCCRVTRVVSLTHACVPMHHKETAAQETPSKGAFCAWDASPHLSAIQAQLKSVLHNG